MTTEFVAYHNRNGADHQLEFNRLYGLGFRMISLSVYQPSSPLYAAVWVKRDGPNWSAVHGLDAAGYQNAFNNAVAHAFHPVILSAAGTLAHPVFAGTFEQRPGPVPLTRIQLTTGSDTDQNTIQHWNKQAHANKWIMTCGALYGDQASPGFAGIWPPNTRNTSWNASGIHDMPDEYQRRFNAQVAGWTRPSYVAVSQPERYLSIFTDDEIGPWIARHGLTSAQYQAEFNHLVPLGFYPVCVQGGGSGAGIRFAVIFARQDELLMRQWTVSGAGVAPNVDQAMHDTLVASGVRGASLAVVKGKRLVFARGYTNAEPGYPAILPTTLFRIASVSKTFAAIAAHQLIAEGKITLTDTLQSVLGLKTPTGANPPDPAFGSITVEDLLLHRSRIDPNWMKMDPQVAAAFGVLLPVTDAQVASFVAAKPLLPTAVDYNNYGYVLLGMIVARKRGKATFYDAIKETILDPLGMKRTRASTSLAWMAYHDEARYHRTWEQQLDLYIEPSVMSPDRPLVPDVYGNICLENAVSTGALSSAAIDQARLIAALNNRVGSVPLSRAAVTAMLNSAANSGRPRAGHGFDGVTRVGTTFECSKGGYIFTSQNGIQFTLDGLGVAICYNGVNDVALYQTWWPVIHSAIHATSWPATADYFPDYSMPPL